MRSFVLDHPRCGTTPGLCIKRTKSVFALISFVNLNYSLALLFAVNPLKMNVHDKHQIEWIVPALHYLFFQILETRRRLTCINLLKIRTCHPTSLSKLTCRRR